MPILLKLITFLVLVVFLKMLVFRLNSDLSLAYIVIESLAVTQTVRRYVNNVSDSAVFTATVEAPSDVDVVVSVLDWNTTSLKIQTLWALTMMGWVFTSSLSLRMIQPCWTSGYLVQFLGLMVHTTFEAQLY